MFCVAHFQMYCSTIIHLLIVLTQKQKQKKSFANCNTTKIHLLIVLTKKKNHLLIVIPPKFVLHYMLPIAIYNLHLFTSIEIPTLFLSISHTLTFLCPPTFIPSPLVLPHIRWSLSPLARYNNVCENTTKGTHRYVGFPQKSISKGEHTLLHYLLKTQPYRRKWHRFRTPSRPHH